MQQRGRTIMYFDNSNIFQGQRDVGWRINVEKLMTKLQEQGDIWQTHFFAAVTDPPRFSQTDFYFYLKKQLRWETHLFPLGHKTVKCFQCGKSRRAFTEKGVDVAIATKMLTHAVNKAFDTAILVSGDKDYLDTVRAIKNLGLRVEIVSFRHSLSKDLANESSGQAILLDTIKADILLEKPDTETEKLMGVEH